MANVVEVHIEASVPFNWLQDDPPNGLPDAEGMCFASLLLSPAISVEHSYESLGYVPNRDGTGGKTAMYRLTIEGQEALSWKFMERLVAALESVGAVTQAYARDLEDAGPWCQINRK